VPSLISLFVYHKSTAVSWYHGLRNTSVISVFLSMSVIYYSACLRRCVPSPARKNVSARLSSIVFGRAVLITWLILPFVTGDRLVVVRFQIGEFGSRRAVTRTPHLPI